MVRLVRHQRLQLQPLQGLADGGAAEAKASGQLGFPQPGAGWQLAGLYARQQQVIRFRAAGPGRLGIVSC